MKLKKLFSSVCSILTALLLASMLILPGCTSEDTSSQTAEITTTTVSTTTQPVYEEWVDDSQDFPTYEEFLNEYTKSRSIHYLHPMPDIVDTWTLNRITLNTSNYSMSYTDTQNDVSIVLEIDFLTSWDSAPEHLDYLKENYYTYSNFEITELNERYYIQHNKEFDSYTLIGITGEENIQYVLGIHTDIENADKIALLKEYMELLAL